MTTTDPTNGATADPTADQVSAERPDAHRWFTVTDLALIAAFAALISACAYVAAIPVGGAGVPITLQTFGVMLTGCLLGPWRGFASVSLYLALGAAGLPVFAEHSGGIGSFTGASSGYLISFPFAALLAGFLVAHVAGEKRKSRALVVFACSITASIVVIHPAGIVWLAFFLDIPLAEALKIDVVYWVGDILKTTLVALIAAEVHRAFPRLLHRR